MVSSGLAKSKGNTTLEESDQSSRNRLDNGLALDVGETTEVAVNEADLAKSQSTVTPASRNSSSPAAADPSVKAPTENKDKLVYCAVT